MRQSLPGGHAWVQGVLILEVGACDDGRRRRLDEGLRTGLGPYPDKAVMNLPQSMR